MKDPQEQADRVRELVAEADPLRRLGVEVLWALGVPDALTLRARQGRRSLTAQLGPGWLGESAPELAGVVTRDLVADVLTPPSMGDGAPRWTRASAPGRLRPPAT